MGNESGLAYRVILNASEVAAEHSLRATLVAKLEGMALEDALADLYVLVQSICELRGKNRMAKSGELL